MPMRALLGSTGSVTVRSMVRPPDSRSLTMTCASRGRLVLAKPGRSTATSALPSAPVAGQPLQGLAHRAELLVGEPELVAGEAGQVLLRRPDGDLALDAEVGGRRAVEIAASHLDEARLLRAQRLAGGLELELQTLGNEILHQERRLRDRRGLGVGVHLDAPRPGHGRRRQRKLGGAPAETLVGQREARMLDAVGPREDQRHGHRRRGAVARAHKRRQVHRLAGAIDAAVGVGEPIHRPRLGPAADAAVGAGRRRRSAMSRNA